MMNPQGKNRKEVLGEPHVKTIWKGVPPAWNQMEENIVPGHCTESY